ncbi:hypothetical protein [Mesorhizobium sp. ORS 3428]|uniref:hypothetical protein n=1 Tax=Mesorhizobium sp. ORS 3428 TaxID=540997 RepID=UPI0008D8E8A2|nr:hypothetical protein [Mesorhizobium sp. ORS 3428]OHV87158.1 hypothetical protein ORS3428_08470 [Mesorhizobium sp. ORS 3428]
MRVLAAISIGLLATTGLAQASSIVVLGVSTSTPSVIRLDAIESGASTPSIVALGDPIPVVTDEKVAAIPEKSGQRSVQAPMIIRGGIVGGAFATPAPTDAAKTAPASTTPTNGTAPTTATPPNGTAAAAPNRDTKAADNRPTTTANTSGGHAQPKVQSQNAKKLPRVGKTM